MISVNIKFHMNSSFPIVESPIVAPLPIAPYVNDLNKMNMSFSNCCADELKVIRNGKLIAVKTKNTLINSLMEQRNIVAPMFNSLASSLIG